MWYVVRHLRRKRLLDEKRRRADLRLGRPAAAITSRAPYGTNSTTLHLGAFYLYGVIPFIACAVLSAVWSRPIGWLLLTVVAIALASSVLVAVHHAEIVALRVGEPLGTLILALAVTVIEVALIASIMLSGGPDTSALARDAVFATVMIVCNGGIGLCLLVGTLRHFVLEFRVEGTSPALSVIIPNSAIQKIES